MQVPQLTFGVALCILLGLFPGPALGALAALLSASPGRSGERAGPRPALARAACSAAFRCWAELRCSALALLLLLGLAFVAVRALSRLGGAARRATAPWLCGYAEEADGYRTSAHDLYGEVKGVLRILGGAPDRPVRPGPSSGEVR